MDSNWLTMFIVHQREKIVMIPVGIISLSRYHYRCGVVDSAILLYLRLF